MSGSSVSALTLTHEFIARHVRPGDFCIDATAGRGNDTAFLCSLVGSSGRVLAMDIQREAADSTQLLLSQRGYDSFARVVLDCHSNISSYAQPDTVRCIVFNLGWLPGGNHSVHTRSDTTIAAVKHGLDLLVPGGIISLCVYYGRDCGLEERDSLLNFLSRVDYRRYTVITSFFHNRPNNPPFPVYITRDE